MHRTVQAAGRERLALLREAQAISTSAIEAKRSPTSDELRRWKELIEKADDLQEEIYRLEESGQSIRASLYRSGDHTMSAPSTLLELVNRSGSFVAERRALSLGTASAGGNTAPIGFVNSLYTHLQIVSPVQAVARVLTTDDEANLQVPTLATFGSAAAVAEGSALAGTDPTFGQVTLKAHRYAQLVRASNTLLSSQTVDLDSLMGEVFARNIDSVTGPLYAFGGGTTAPQGYASGAGSAVTGGTGVAGAFDFDDLADMLTGLDSTYQQSAVWLMSPSAVGTLRKLKDDESRPLWQPAMTAGEPPTLFGRPIYVDRHLGAVATGGTSVVVMDPSAFALRFGGGGIRIDRSDDAFFSTDEVGFRAVVATDSQYLDNKAAVRFVGGTA
jgi:HK97 family phage major capsid protein